MGVPVRGERGLPGSLDEALAQELAPIYCLWLGKEHHLTAEDIGKCGAGLNTVRVGRGLTSGSGQSQTRSEKGVQKGGVIALGQRAV